MAMAEKAVEWRARQAPCFRIGSREARLPVENAFASSAPPANQTTNATIKHGLIESSHAGWRAQAGMRVLRQHASDLQRHALCLSLCLVSCLAVVPIDSPHPHRHSPMHALSFHLDTAKHPRSGRDANAPSRIIEVMMKKRILMTVL